MKTRVFCFEIPPLHLAGLHDRLVKGIKRKRKQVIRFINNNWMIIFGLGVLFLITVFGPIVDRMYAK